MTVDVDDLDVLWADLTVPAPPRSSADWNRIGVLHMPNLLAQRPCEEYRAAWWRAHGGTNGEAPNLGGWPDACPYMRVPELLALFMDPALAAVLEFVLGEPAGLHLCLTPMVSTRRDWHQDQYLNPAHVGDRYAAVWVALDRIDPASGPFQYVPGSHRWPQVAHERIAGHLDVHDPDWPTRSEELLSPLFEREIGRRNGRVVSHLPERAGDVLVWHGRLLHRGSRPRRGFHGLRPAVIAHFSGLSVRPEWPEPVQHERGGWFFPLEADRIGDPREAAK